jgi:hypothetical protein
MISWSFDSINNSVYTYTPTYGNLIDNICIDINLWRPINLLHIVYNKIIFTIGNKSFLEIPIDYIILFNSIIHNIDTFLFNNIKKKKTNIRYEFSNNFKKKKINVKYKIVLPILLEKITGLSCIPLTLSNSLNIKLVQNSLDDLASEYTDEHINNIFIIDIWSHIMEFIDNNVWSKLSRVCKFLNFVSTKIALNCTRRHNTLPEMKLNVHHITDNIPLPILYKNVDDAIHKKKIEKQFRNMPFIADYIDIKQFYMKVKNMNRCSIDVKIFGNIEWIIVDIGYIESHNIIKKIYGIYDKQKINRLCTNLDNEFTNKMHAPYDNRYIYQLENGDIDKINMIFKKKISANINIYVAQNKIFDINNV